LPGTLIARRFLPHARDAVRTDVRIAYGDRVEEIGSAGNQPADADTLVLPPFCNAHDHGRGLKTLAYGVSDTAVEAWVPGTYTLPPIDPYLIAAASFARMARAGIGSVVHCHLGRDPAGLVREAAAVRRAADDVGIRVAFVMPLRDRFRLAYGAEEMLFDYLAPADAEAVRSHWLRPIAPIAVQLAAAQEVAATCEGPLFEVQLGPTGVERCSDAMLRAVAALSHRSGRRMHMHFLESKYQRQWVDKEYPGGVVEHLRGLGMLSPRLTIGHGTWLRPQECAILAAHGVTVSINTSSNLRLKSGVAPVAEIRRAGMKFALGLDALALDDDDDMAREMRLARLLHQGHGFDEAVSGEEFLVAATDAGAKVASPDPGAGRIAAGGPADFLELDFGAMSADLIDGLYEPLDVVRSRASARFVRRLVVAGRTVVEGGKALGIDEPAIGRALHAELEGHAPALRALRPVLARYQAAIGRYFLDGCHLAAGGDAAQ